MRLAFAKHLVDDVIVSSHLRVPPTEIGIFNEVTRDQISTDRPPKPSDYFTNLFGFLDAVREQNI